MFACSPDYARQHNQHFELIEASSQEWIAGARGGGRGVNYKLLVKIMTNSPIAFDSIWIGGRKLNVTPEGGGMERELTLAKGDVVALLASDYTGGPAMDGRNEVERMNDSSSDSAKAPIAYKGAALLEYTVSGSVKYFTIPDFKVLPTIYGQ